LGGLWHGAGWTFIIWGALYGIFQMTAYASKRLRKKIVKKTGLQRLPRLHAALSIFITFNLVSFAWIFFRAASFNQALAFIGQIRLRFPADFSVHLVYNSVLLLFFITIEYFNKNRERIVFWQRFPRPVKMAAFAFFCCLLIVLALDTSNEFIYMQF
jgi:alginate O-acetyltransferase complex protein AlgI